MKNILAFITLILLTFSVAAQQQRHEIAIPDILGYKTLICDFHMHTVFSDGSVWPTVRVDEAYRDGLDAISITEHVEYHPHKKDVRDSIYRSYEIAKPRADAKNIILVKGAEITRSMPPGHFNALFIDDYDTLNQPGWYESLKAAKVQGAFIFWNHPGWRQKDEIPIWYKEHSQLYHDGLFSGIEIANERSYYPLSYQWAIDSNLTIIGNSDIHSPVDYFYDKSKGEQRNLTLVFASERSEEGIKEALEQGRTAVWYKDLIMGKQEFLQALIYEAVDHEKVVLPEPGESYSTSFYNTSDLPMSFELVERPDGITCPKLFRIDPHCSVLFKISRSDTISIDNDPMIIYEAKNFLVAPDKGCILKLKIGK